MNKEIIEHYWSEILNEIGEDPEREGLKSTPTRIARMYENVFYRYKKKLMVMNESQRNLLTNKDIIPITVFKTDSQDMLIRDTSFISFCEHHIVPFAGKAWVGIIPDEKLLGMNKIDKIVKYFAAGLQIQERLTSEIADWIWKEIEPLGVIVVIKADHFCARLQNDDGKFMTSSVRGCFKNTKEARAEFLNLIK